jgi:hypothetical protein
LVVENPGGGTSEIVKATDEEISYVRGNSTISIAIEDMFSAFRAFEHRRVSSSDLRRFAPAVFDSDARPAGHSCNCTFLFTLLRSAGLAGELEGTGVRGRPFAVTFSGVVAEG